MLGTIVARERKPEESRRARARGAVTVVMEIAEDSEDRLLLRGWTTSSERWWKAMQYGGSAMALTGLFCAYTAFSVPVVVGGLAAIALGGGSAIVGLNRRWKARRRLRRPWLSRSVDVEWRGPSAGLYRDVGEVAQLSASGRHLEAHALRTVLLLEMSDGDRTSWTVLLHHDDGVFEPFPPFVGDEDALRVAVERLATRCGATFVER